MVKSMTGYGKAETVTGDRKITVEIRSLNGKQLDLTVKTPMLYRQFEYEIRIRSAKALQRGKTDILVSCESSGAETASNINAELFKTYIASINGIISEDAALSQSISSDEMRSAMFLSAIRMPDVVSSDSNAVSDTEREALFATLDRAVASFDECRAHEGDILIQDLLHRVDLIQDYKRQVEPYEKARIETIKNRIRDSIASLAVPVDANRLEQEMIFYVEKLDITEEKVRLDKHCNYFRQVAAEEESVGRKLGFIAQEMGREINTLGSKANDSEMQILVVKMKDELEKIKEQVLNIL